MANPKRPDKVVLNLCVVPANVVFREEIGRSGKVGIYQSRLLEAINQDKVIQIKQSDKYMLQQLKAAAKKLKLRLVYGIKDDSLFVKPIAPSEQEQRLILLLRYSRSLAELQSAKLELNLPVTLQGMKDRGTAHTPKSDGKWVLTEKGMDLLPPATDAAKA